MITDSLQQVLTTLYPLYKTEVYNRREQMMKCTAFGSIGLLAMLCALLLSPHRIALSPLDAILLAIASLVWSALFGGLILQHHYRHRLAKQVLIQLERALGFYEEGLFVDKQPLYPEQWKTAWLTDRSLILYYSALGLFNGLFLLALLLV